jgi:predicted metal-dependent HD superfamily phosphohydrolase
MTEAGFQALKADIIQRLSGLDARLTYHNLAHTLDVMEQAVRISVEESILDPRQLLLVKIAALYHDTGFLFTYRGHEEKSCEIARQDLAGTDLTADEVNTITGMIMATKIPQSPANLMEEIICDADLDYLGRDDYPPISDNLKVEFLSYGIIGVDKDWDPLQIDFFEKHRYFTRSSRTLRAPKKQQYLAMLKEKAW